MLRELEKRFQDAERLFKQGRGDAATQELRRMAEDLSSDLLVLNRIGDIFARHNQKQDALRTYERIYEDFLRAGLLPKAIAVLKKTLRIEPQHVPAVLRLGDAYAKAQVLGDARSHLLGAAERFLEDQDPDKARQVYEKLVAIEPKDPLHRVRLAETRVLEGDAAGAYEDLLAAAAELSGQDKGADAEKTYRRASELVPARTEAVAGIARALALQGRAREGVAFLEGAARRPGAGAALVGDLFFLYEQNGRIEDALALLTDDRAHALTDAAIEEMVRRHTERGSASEAWRHVDLVLERWVASARHDRVVPLLERLSAIDGQRVPALERIHRAQKGTADRAALARTLEKLVRAYWAESSHAQASAVLDELKVVEPQSSLVAESISRSKTIASRHADPASAAEREPAATKLALPQTPADREFTAEHLTQAESFRKYDLAAQAVAQVRLVVDRFPGHVVAHEKLVDLLHASNDRDALRDALAGLALARHSADDVAGAREAARRAQHLGALPATVRRALESASLLASSGTAASPAPATPAAAAPTAAGGDVTGDELEIVFDDEDDAVDGLLASPAAGSGILYPPAHAVEEIMFFLSQGMKAEAAQGIAALRARGFGGDKLRDLERQAAVGKMPLDELRNESSTVRLDPEDLLRISGSLDPELEAETPGVDEAAPATEQSVDEVFRAFKDRIASEVGSEDFRTHYDLGIAYKEMGLLDDAIGEFTLASESADLSRDACSMLGLCHRERGDLPAAAVWYRRALGGADTESPEVTGIRYDLAEVLAESGDLGGALEMFAEVARRDPAYRDVTRRVSELKTRSGS